MIEQLIPRRKFRIQSKEFGNQWQTISYQKKASDVELEGGETVQHRIDNLVAKITELSTVIRNFKTQEGTDHDAFKRRIGLLYEQIRSGIGGVYNTFLTIEAEGEGAEDYNRLSGEFNTFQNQTRTKLTQLEADVEELLSYEPDAEGGAEKVDAYDYLDKLIDELEEYMSLVLTQLAQVVGDGDITDVLLNANVDITDQTDTSLAAALKIQHGKISGLETMMNQMGVGNPPYTWERYEYSSLDDPATCPVKVTAMTNTGDTTTYVPVWRVVFFYQPVFKLLKMTGYMGVSGTGTLDRSVYLSMDVETNKLRFFYTLLDNYERYQWINQDENGVISTVLDQYIDPRQGLLRNGYDSTTVLRVEQWSGLSLPSYYNFNYLGISMGDTGDTAYNPSGFSVWDSGLPEKPEPPNNLYFATEQDLLQKLGLSVRPDILGLPSPIETMLNKCINQMSSQNSPEQYSYYEYAWDYRFVAQPNTRYSAFNPEGVFTGEKLTGNDSLGYKLELVRRILLFIALEDMSISFTPDTMLAMNCAPPGQEIVFEDYVNETSTGTVYGTTISPFLPFKSEAMHGTRGLNISSGYRARPGVFSFPIVYNKLLSETRQGVNCYYLPTNKNNREYLCAEVFGADIRNISTTRSISWFLSADDINGYLYNLQANIQYATEKNIDFYLKWNAQSREEYVNKICVIECICYAPSNKDGTGVGKGIYTEIGDENNYDW